METIICRSYQSFIDVCDNELVCNTNVHCTFPMSKLDVTWMQNYLKEKRGGDLSFTPFLQEFSPNLV
jgi:hypothetical protein